MTPVAPRRQTNWDARAAGNFIGGGTGTGLLVAAAIAAMWGAFLDIPVLLALLLVGGGLLLVWLEIGKPWRFMNVYRQPKRSWMTREAYAALPVFACGGLAWLSDSAPLVILTAAFALAFLYCQGRILTASKGIPAWREPMMLPLILTTGLTEGMGLFAAVIAATDPVPGWVGFVLFNLAVLRVIVWYAYRGRLVRRAPKATIDILRRMEGGFVLGGNILPVLLILAAVLLPDVARALVFLAGIVALLSGWFLKFVLVTRAAYTQGYALPKLPARGELPQSASEGARPGWN